MADEWDVVETVELAGFDEDGEPEIRVLANGKMQVVFEFMPPCDYEDEPAFDEFDKEMALAIGVEVAWEDREIFLIHAPKADTIEKIRDFVSGYRKNLGTRRFEMVEGASSKFWEVRVSEDELTVRYGRIGTAGQEKVKQFDEPAEARAERDKLIREKTKKGYEEVEPEDGDEQE